MRRTLSVLVVVGLALAVVLVLASRGGESPSGTDAQASTTSSVAGTTTTAPPTTTTFSTTTSSPTEVEVVETVEQAEAILRELWFGWFEGIYNEDEDQIREVVGNPTLIAEAVNQFGVMEFASQPSRAGLSFQDTEILRTDAECVAIWSEVGSAFRDGSISGVHVFRPLEGSWVLINAWPLRGDMWESDCEVSLP